MCDRYKEPTEIHRDNLNLDFFPMLRSEASCLIKQWAVSYEVTQENDPSQYNLGFQIPPDCDCACK